MTSIPLPIAPGSDEYVSLALANTTVSLPGGHHFDELNTPEATTAWLVAQGLVPHQTTLQSYCQKELDGLRTDLRAAFAAHVHDTVPSQATVDGINRALTTMPTAPLLRHDIGNGFRISVQHPVTSLVEHAMSRIAEDGVMLLTGEHKGALTQCQASPCDRFVLRTHARRHWCSVRCGDRVRAARAYARRGGV